MSSQEVVQLTTGPNDTPNSWSPDGKELAFVRPRALDANNSGTINNIFIYSVEKPKDVHPLQVSTFAQTHPEFSPNGHWLAYDSMESGRGEVYVQGYPDPDERVQISIEGGMEPAWSKTSNEMYYLHGSTMMAVRFAISGGKFIPEKPVALFDGVEFRTNGRGYDVSSDGRFLLPKAQTEETEERLRKIFPSTLRVVLNWTTELQRIVK
jgi:dipeptidyl aminopeptidase/acylaminoacyl peptidase